MKLHVKHNHNGFVFDKVASFDNIKELSVEITKVLKSMAAFNCDESCLEFEIEYEGSLIKKSVVVKDYRTADRIMDKFIKGLEYIWPELR